MLLIIPLSLGLAKSLYSDQESRVQAFTVQRWSAEDNLPQNAVRRLLQSTRDGYLWIGTLHGLVRFDGKQFKIFDRSNTPEMTSDAINNIVEDARDGSIWIGTGAGVLRYAESRFEAYGIEHGVMGVSVWPSRGGGVWCRSQAARLTRIRHGQVKHWNFNSASGGIGACHNIWEEEDSQLVIAGTEGLYSLNLKTEEVRRFAETGQESLGEAALRDGNGNWWVGGYGGVWLRQGTNWICKLARDPAGSWPSGLWETQNGTVWLALRTGQGDRLCRWVGNDLVPLASPKIPSDISIYDFIEDREGNYWIGTNLGLIRLRPRIVHVYDMQTGLRNDDAQSVGAGLDNSVFIGTGQGVSAIRDGTVSNLLFLDPKMTLRSEKVSTLIGDSRNRLWAIYDYDRLALFDGTWRTVDPPAKFPAWNCRLLYRDRQDQIWVASDEHGIFRGEPDRWTHVLKASDLARRRVAAMHQDRRGDMWFGTYGGGLNRLRDGQVTRYQTSGDEYNNRAWWIHEDSDGVLWIGSQNGLNRFVPPNPGLPENHEERGFFTFTVKHGLSDNVVNNIQEDEFGFLWLSGLRGICRIARSELNAVAAGKQSQVHCVVFGEADGMLSAECNGGDNQPAGCTDRLGRIWFPTTKGVVVIDPKTARRNEVAPPVVIEQVVADDEVIFGDDTPRRTHAGNGASKEHKDFAVAKTAQRLPPGRARSVSISFTANSFVTPDKVRFKYRLIGHDAGWREPSRHERSAHYTNLKPGSYSFRVIASNNHGYWNEAGASFAFSVAPHLYQTWPFYGACALAVVGIAAGVQSYRLRVQRRILALEQQHALELERTRIAQDMHDDIGSRLTQLSVLGELAKREIANPKRARAHWEKLNTTSKQIFDAMDEIVWAVNPKQDSLSGLVSYLREYAPEVLGTAGMHCRLDFPSPVPLCRLSAETRHHLFLVIKEALHNVIKHARAKEVWLRLRIQNKVMMILIHDDGCGFSPDQPSGSSSLGLENMRERAAQIGGRLDVVSQLGGGTKIMISMPLS